MRQPASQPVAGKLNYWHDLLFLIKFSYLKKTASSNSNKNEPVVIAYHDLNNQSTHTASSSAQKENNQTANNLNSSPDQSTPDELNKRLNVKFSNFLWNFPLINHCALLKDLKPSETVQNRLKTKRCFFIVN